MVSGNMKKVLDVPLLWLRNAEKPEKSTPILFVHGMWGWHWYWSKYIDYFSKQGYNCFAVDFKGHNPGAAKTDIENSSIEDYTTDVKKAVEYISEQHSLPYVIAHSMGGIVLQKTLETVVVNGAVLLSSAAPKGILVFPQFWTFVILVKYLVLSLFRKSVLPSLKELIYIVFESVSGKEREKAIRFVVRESGKAYRQSILGGVAVNEKRIQSPLLVIGAGKDKIVKPKLDQKIAEKYAADVKIFHEHTHWLVREDGYEEICAYIENWFNKKES